MNEAGDGRSATIADGRGACEATGRHTGRFLNGELTTLRSEGTTTRDLAADLRSAVEDLRDDMLGWCGSIAKAHRYSD